MRIITCNVRCATANDGDNGWAHRRQTCVDVIRSRRADVLCFQEVVQEQHGDLTAAFPEYAAYGIVDSPTGHNPTNLMMYRPEVLQPVSAGGCWLSTTPHVTGSRSWESRCVRLQNWLRLRCTDSGAEIRVINTHLDHISQAAREGQADVINDDAAAYPDTYAQILTGDMNCDARNPAIERFLAAGWRDTYAAVHGSDESGHMYHGFQGAAFVSEIGKIDWIFVRGKPRVSAAEIVTDALGGRFPSDHYFISADIEI